jgi:hypothetical protein
MKKIYTLIFTALSLSFTAQIEGSWSLNPAAGALGVGPDSASTAWWGSDANAPTDRNCLFDDSIVFSSNGTYEHFMDGSTWLETWQAGSPAEGCGTPIAPHDGGSNTYTFSNGILTVSGPGAHIGLAKVHNGGEDGMPANDQIAYYVTFSGANSEIMTVDISFPNAGGTNGLGWWRYVYLKNGAAPPPPPASYTVTFNVHTDLIAGNVSADGIYIGGGFVGGNDALLLDDSDGDGVWSGSTSLPAAGGHFTILNGNCSDWSCKEDISGQPCADAGNYNDRNNLLGGFSQDTTLNLQYGSCDTPGTGINELDNKLSIFPNPSNGVLNIKASQNISSVNIYNMIGNLVMVKNIANNQSVLNIESLTNGVYFIELNLNNGSTLNSKIIKR